MQIRRVRSGDEDRLEAVRLRALLDAPTAFGSTHAQEVAKPAAHWVDSVSKHRAGGGSAIWLAVDGGATTGMAGAYSPGNSGAERHVFGMWVAPEARRRGIGRALIDEATEWSWESGAEFATLWVVEGNDAAAALYESAGFLNTGVGQPLPSHPHLIEWLLRASRPEGK